MLLKNQGQYPVCRADPLCHITAFISIVSTFILLLFFVTKDISVTGVSIYLDESLACRLLAGSLKMTLDGLGY